MSYNDTGITAQDSRGSEGPFTANTEQRAIAPSALPQWTRGPTPVLLSDVKPLRTVEREYVLRVVRQIGSVGRAAPILGISTSKIYRVLKGIAIWPTVDPNTIRPLRDVLADHVEEAVRLAEGNLSKASAALGIDPGTLRKWRAVRAAQLGE